MPNTITAPYIRKKLIGATAEEAHIFITKEMRLKHWNRVPQGLYWVEYSIFGEITKVSAIQFFVSRVTSRITTVNISYKR